MQVLLLDDEPRRHEALMTAFLKAGFQIISTSSHMVALTFLETGVVDLLIASEEVNGRLSHNVALLAEHRNPLLSTILISERVGEEVEELYDLIPSVHCIVGDKVSSDIILTLGRASVTSPNARISFERAASPRELSPKEPLAVAA